MVCKACRAAGDLNTAAVVDHPEGSEGQRRLFAAAQTAHENCNQACDCAHKVGTWVIR